MSETTRAFASETDVPVHVEFRGGGAGAPERLVVVDEDGRAEEATR
jgi:hypothetical protein